MNEEELDSTQELIERKLLMAEVMGGLTSHDKKFIDLWNYTIQLQNNWNELKKYISEQINYYSLDDEDYKEFNVLDSVEQYMQELEGNNE